MTEYVPYQTYYLINNNFVPGSNIDNAFNTVSPTVSSFSITSNTTQVNAAGTYIGLEGKTDTAYTLGANSSTTSYSNTSVNVPYLANCELRIPSATGALESSNALAN
ncbi:hypothetical protein J6W20_02260 [bacterium]|nr:hypothetical protein [bacterium]